MTPKAMPFDGDALVVSVQAMAGHVGGERRINLRTRALVPTPVKSKRAAEVVAIRRKLDVS